MEEAELLKFGHSLLQQTSSRAERQRQGLLAQRRWAEDGHGWSCWMFLVSNACHFWPEKIYCNVWTKKGVFFLIFVGRPMTMKSWHMGTWEFRRELQSCWSNKIQHPKSFIKHLNHRWVSFCLITRRKSSCPFDKTSGRELSRPWFKERAAAREWAVPSKIASFAGMIILIFKLYMHVSQIESNSFVGW